MKTKKTYLQVGLIVRLGVGVEEGEAEEVEEDDPYRVAEETRTRTKLTILEWSMMHR